MAVRALTPRLALVTLVVLLAGCAPLPATGPAATPPPPLARVTHAPESPTAASQALPQPAETLPTRTPLPDSLAELAREAYGARLVEWIEIPALSILAPVLPVGWQPVANALDENLAVDWDSPEASVGWVVASTLPGDGGNILMYGHNNLHASVFLRLSELQPGERIQLRTGERDWAYQVQSVDILPVLTAAQDLDAYQAYFQPEAQEQLTLLSCWPPVGNTHRVVVIAVPVQEADGAQTPAK